MMHPCSADRAAAPEISRNPLRHVQRKGRVVSAHTFTLSSSSPPLLGLFYFHTVSAVIMAKGSSLKEPLHPYYPLEVEIVGYLANEYDVPTLLASFAGGCVLIFAVTLAIVTRLHSGLRGADKATILWFTLCETPCLPSSNLRIWLTRQAGSFICSSKVCASQLKGLW